MNKFMKAKSQKNSSILALTFEGSMMTAMELRRRDERCEVVGRLREPLSQDILTGNPDLIGAEIRKLLEDAGIREKRCVLSLPLSWVYIIHQEIPDVLPETDVDNYIRLQVEKKLPFSPEDVVLSLVRFEAPSDGRCATIACVPVQHVQTLEKIMKAARLQLSSMTLGIASLPGPGDAGFRITLLAHEDGIDLVIGRNENALYIRSFPGAVSMEKEEHFIDADMIVRELRITLGRLTEDVRREVKFYSILGDGCPVDIFSEELALPFSHLGLEAEKKRFVHHSIVLNDLPAPHACAAAMDHLWGRSNGFEFLPPAVGRLEKIIGHISSRSIFWLIGAGVAIIFIVAGVFMIQAYILRSYQKEWAAMEPDVKEVTMLQDKLRKYRPWHDSEIRSLAILKEMTKAFPEEGNVWVKSVEIRNMSSLQVSGEAKNERVWLEMLGKMRVNPVITNLKVSQVKEGVEVLQFTMSFSM